MEIRRIINGEEMVFELTNNELYEIRYNDDVENGKASLEFYLDTIDDEKEREKIEELMNDKAFLWDLNDTIMNSLLNDAGSIELEIAEHEVKRKLRGKER